MKQSDENSIVDKEQRFIPERRGPHKSFAQEIEGSASRVGKLLIFVVAMMLLFGFYQFVKFVVLILA